VGDSLLTPDNDAPFPTRRELRAQYAAASVSPSRRSRRRATITAPRRTPSSIAAPLYALPAAKAPRTSRFRALITIVAVGGLFTTAGLPAYAIGTSADVVAGSATTDSSTIAVSAQAKLGSAARGSFTATTPGDLAQQRSTSLKGVNYEAYINSGAREAGDDYPWFSELSNNQGGGLSPLNYFYRECVDFVAWRLNRDVGSTSAPFTFDWHYLTPSGGDASQWAYAWKAHGWATGTTPKVGSVAWFPGHVAYVSKVNKDGTVFLEEYNYQSDHLYGTRTIAATDVPLYLYAPPLPANTDG
jgi:surface antigen